MIKMNESLENADIRQFYKKQPFLTFYHMNDIIHLILKEWVVK